MSRLKLKTGDVFTVPVDETRVGVGQVVATYGKDAYYFAIFDTTASDAVSVDLEQATQQRMVFLALSLDARLAAGHWNVVGHQPVRSGMPLPTFKEVVGSPLGLRSSSAADRRLFQRLRESASDDSARARAEDRQLDNGEAEKRGLPAGDVTRDRTNQQCASENDGGLHSLVHDSSVSSGL